MGEIGSTESNLRAQPTTFTQSKTLHSLKYHEREAQLETDEDGHVCSRELSVWRDSFKQRCNPRFITINSRRILDGPKPDNSFTDDHKMPGYQATADGRVAIKPKLHLLRNSTELPLVRVVHREEDTEVRSYVGEYQAETLFSWVVNHPLLIEW